MAISSQDLWNQILERLQLQLTRPAFETWIKTAVLQEVTDLSLIHI